MSVHRRPITASQDNGKFVSTPTVSVTVEIEQDHPAVTSTVNIGNVAVNATVQGLRQRETSFDELPQARTNVRQIRQLGFSALEEWTDDLKRFIEQKLQVDMEASLVNGYAVQIPMQVRGQGP